MESSLPRSRFSALDCNSMFRYNVPVTVSGHSVGERLVSRNRRQRGEGRKKMDLSSLTIATGNRHCSRRKRKRKDKSETEEWRKDEKGEERSFLECGGARAETKRHRPVTRSQPFPPVAKGERKRDPDFPSSSSTRGHPITSARDDAFAGCNEP